MNIYNFFEKKITEIITASALRTRDGSVLDLSRISVETPRDSLHGDIATNAAMVLAKSVGTNPRELAEKFAAQLVEDPNIANVTIAGPGFINIKLTVECWHELLKVLLNQGLDYGRSTIGNGLKVNVEYVSANPTGPVHVGHARGAVVGDVLANLLSYAGFDVTKEYYINDAGGQVDVLARSVILRYRQALGEDIGAIPDGYYPGEYLIPLGKALAEEYGDKLLVMGNGALPLVKKRAVDAMMHMIRDDLQALNIHHDIFFSEQTLHEDEERAIRTAINDLTLNGYVYKGKLPPPKGQVPDDWEDREQTLFRSSDVGDDQDRPLVKSDGTYTYFAADVAYFKDKYQRGYDEMIYVLGADHGGYVKRLEAVAKAISGGKAKLATVICQLVNLYKNGAPFKMSKRAGNFVTMRDVVEEVGCDAVRFMMLYRKSDAQLDFDFAKVTEQSKDNPVFYVQYAHARCHSILRQAKEQLQIELSTLTGEIDAIQQLNDDGELLLIKKLAEYPRLIELAARHKEPHRIAFYLYDLASNLHSQWNKGNDNPSLRFVKSDDRELTLGRVALVKAVSQILASGLQIIGADAPVEMR